MGSNPEASVLIKAGWRMQREERPPVDVAMTQPQAKELAPGSQ